MTKLFSTFVIFLLMGISFSQATNDQTSDVKDTKEKVLEPIPVTEITSKADETISTLNKILADSEPKSSITSIEEVFPGTLDSLKTLHADPRLEQLNDLNVRILQNLYQEWTFYFKQLSGANETLQTRSQELVKQSNDLKEMSDIWHLTGENALKDKAPRAIRDRVKSIINEISNLEKKVSSRLNNILVLQNKISKAQIDITDLMDRIKKAEQDLRDQLFVIDSPPLWEAFQTDMDSLQFTSQIQASWTEFIRSNVAFITINKKSFYLHIVIYIALIILMLYLNRRNKRDNLFNEDDQALKASAYFVSRPFSAALLIALIFSIWIYPEGTSTVAEFILILFLIPVLRLIPGILPTEIHKPIYFLYAMFVIDILQKNALGFVLFQRILLLLVTIVAIIIILWLWRPKGPIRSKKDESWKVLLGRAAPVILLLLIITFIGNLVGSYSLANTIGWGIVESGYILVTLIITTIVGSSLITVLIRQRRKHASQFVKTYAQKIERWAYITISLIAFFIWARATLKTFGFLQPFYDWFDVTLSHTWTIGTLEISVEAIFDFTVILIFTFVFTRLIRIILDMEIFPRIKLPRGIPGAISMVIRYTIVAAGILIALSSVGLDLGKFGLMAGALGVGLGFGLQNIIANFISGLILAFERPIQVGDTVQVDTVYGNVLSIGVRSSTVKTFDGSEVIVPNADLISHRVTNWTLSDRLRRMELPVKVAFGHDPHQVLELIVTVAKEHPDVLENPEPFSVFNGFGDNYLDFSLYYWIPTNVFFKVKTEVALGVHDLLISKGINTPTPQRAVRMILSDDQTAKQIGIKKPIRNPAPRKKPGLKKDSGK